MIPEARSSALALLALVLAGAARGEGGGAFGLSKEGLAAALATKDPAPLISLSDAALEDEGSFGAAAYCYLARRLEPAVGEGADAARRLYRRAYDRSGGFLRREAGMALLRNLGAAGRWNERLSFSGECEKDLGPSWSVDRARLEAACALGLYADAAAIAARIPAAYPEEAAKDADALAFYSALASMRSGTAARRGSAWKASFRRLILEGQYSDWSARAFGLLDYEPGLRASFSAEELHAAAMRDAVRRRDYGAAYKEARLSPGAALSPAAPRAVLADAGKAFLYSGMAKEGEPVFSAIEAAASRKPEGPAGGGAWTALYYRARFARALERWELASSLFRQAAAWAGEKGEADSCLWYAADSDYRGALAAAKRSSAARKDASPKPKAAPVPETEAAPASDGAEARAALLAALSSASSSWTEPERFDDLADSLMGEALRARDFDLVETMADRLSGRLSPEAGARLAYASARILELGLGSKPEDNTDERDAGTGARRAAAASRFAALASDGGAPLYYRALAAWRAGIEPTLVPPAAEAAAPPADIVRGDLEAFLDGMILFGLPDEAYAEARSREPELDDGALSRLARRLSASGRPDCALRLELELASKINRATSRDDLELLYPRPYLDAMRSRRGAGVMSEALAFGLVRSESAFRADIRSRAGAIGLTQLMPATAAAQAKALGIEAYDLEKPEDSLAIGLAHFEALLRQTGMKPLRAMMAYNAGWGQYRRGSEGAEGLPDDLLVEAFRLGETREYCRKILSASVMYDALYYGKGLAGTVGELVGSD